MPQSPLPPLPQFPAMEAALQPKECGQVLYNKREEVRGKKKPGSVQSVDREGQVLG